MAGNPALLVLDEVDAALDETNQQLVASLLKVLAAMCVPLGLVHRAASSTENLALPSHTPGNNRAARNQGPSHLCDTPL